MHFVLHTENAKKGKIKLFHIGDVPGHFRLRPKLEESVPQAAVIVFVVDALEFLPNCRATSEYFQTLSFSWNHNSSGSRWRKKLLRASRSAVSTADIANDFTIGIEGEVFSFSHCCNKVIVAEASGLNGETVQVQDFIREYIKP